MNKNGHQKWICHGAIRPCLFLTGQQKITGKKLELGLLGSVSNGIRGKLRHVKKEKENHQLLF